MEGYMKVVVGVICICITIVIFGPGCSDEEQIQQPEEKVVVKKNIPKKPEPAPVAVVVKPKPPVQKKKAPQTTIVKKGEQEPEETVTQKKPEVKKEKGYYFTKKDDNLAGIAAKLDVYKDPMKWPLIYRLNIDKLETIKLDRDLPSKAIPKDTKLKIITPEEAGKNLEKRANAKYVINVLSSQSDERVVINTVKLIKAGYLAYITKVNVKGKDWLRVRIGFYNRKKDADSDSRKITEMLKIPDIWVTNVGKEEFKSFGKY
jgi:cell division septation protein DedD